MRPVAHCPALFYHDWSSRSLPVKKRPPSLFFIRQTEAYASPSSTKQPPSLLLIRWIEAYASLFPIKQ
jgi:hypothetical protein